jgi:hypothetical protein
MRIVQSLGQAGPNEKGRLVTYAAENVSPDMSFLEMLDVVNEGLIAKGEDPIAFDSDCREGICGTCGFLVDGVAHGPMRGSTVCQLHMRSFKDGDTITLEPWRAAAFPLVKDLVVDRGAFDRIIQAGGYTSINVGGAQDGNAILIPKPTVEQAWTQPPSLRRVRRRLQERVGGALHVGEGVAPRAPSQGQVERRAASSPWWMPVRQLLGTRVRSRVPEGNLDHDIARMNREIA